MITTLVTVADRWDGDPPAFWPIFPILWFLFFLGAVFLAIRFTRRRCDQSGVRPGEARLAERFAAGEIEEEEYGTRLEVLRR